MLYGYLITVLLLSKICACEGAWQLAMNLNPNDGHVMQYCTGWHEDIEFGDIQNAFNKDYISQHVRHLPVNYIAICRHYNGEVQALKIWRFKEPNKSLLSRFQDPGKVHATGNEIYSFIVGHDPPDDPIFSKVGALVFNWVVDNNGVRIANSGTHLDSTLGLGGHYWIFKEFDTCEGNSSWQHEVLIKDKCYVMGKNHGIGDKYKEVEWAANYSIFVSNAGLPFNVNSPLNVNMAHSLSGK